MKAILSIQSHVAYGYVGNRAAVFPLQLMGYDVIAVNTVQFSNHPGYGSHTGQAFETRHIEDVIAGLEERGIFPAIDAVLSGYMGNEEHADIVLHTVDKIRKVNPGVLFCCDPVMGDTGKGFYVPEGLRNFFRSKAVAAATIMTPNQFELGFLAGMDIRTLKDARKACNDIHERGVSTVLLTSLQVKETKKNEIQMLASQADGKQWLVTTPKLKLDPMPNGAGDMTSALFLGRLLAGEKANTALENVAGSVFGVFEKTQFLGQRELVIVPAQDCFRIDRSPFEAVQL